MSKKLLFTFCGIFALSGVFGAAAQTPSQTTTPSQSTSPETQPGSSAVDNQGVNRYRLGPGDLLDVRVFGQADLNSTVEIDEDGNISSLPFIEDPIPARCRNEKEVQKAITEAYAKYIVKPRVSVRVLERRSRQPASIFGAVRTPTRVSMLRRLRLHELLATAGGITANASGTIQIMHTEPELCPEPEDVANNLVARNSVNPTAANTTAGAPTATSDSTPNTAGSKEPEIGELRIITINTLKGGFGSDDPYIRPGDIVIVTEGLPVYVTGLVVQPGPIVLKEHMTLQRAIAMVGGPQRLAKSEVFIYRQKEGKNGIEPLKFNYDDIKKGRAEDPLLQPYDIIDVGRSSTFSGKGLADLFRGMATSTLGIIPQRLPVY
ncbi:MAG TPA: polysaccharide biosynthesis/export family protein [Pyrinomonadaceae bacterium]|jgi:polysaccharide export outer membrane protein